MFMKTFYKVSQIPSYKMKHMKCQGFTNKKTVGNIFWLILITEQKEVALSKGGRQYLNWADIQKMTYTWDVVSEVLRLTSPIIGSWKEVLEDFNYQGYSIPKGWKVLQYLFYLIYFWWLLCILFEVFFLLDNISLNKLPRD